MKRSLLAIAALALLATTAHKVSSHLIAATRSPLEGNRYIAPRRANEDGQDNGCQNSLQQLFTMSPTPVYSIQKP